MLTDKYGLIFGAQTARTKIYAIFSAFYSKFRCVTFGTLPMITFYTGWHRRPDGGEQSGAVAPTLEFENDDVIRCVGAKYPKMFGRAFGARM